MFNQEQDNVEGKIRSFAYENNLPALDKIQWSPIPFTGEWGISTSFFQTAAQEKRLQKIPSDFDLTVPERAQQIAEAVIHYLETPPGFSRIEAKNGYLNLYFSSEIYSARVIDRVLQEANRFGAGSPKNTTVMVEFSQPNTHKSFHVGHLRNLILGSTICNILEFAGFSVIRANYIGDIGLHVIKWLWNYINFHSGEIPSEDRTRWMGDLYSEADQRLEQSPAYEYDVRNLFARWDQQDPEILELWKKTREWSLEGFNQIYDLLDVRFDRIYYESEVEESGKELVTKLIQDGIAEDERPDGPVIVRIDEILGLTKEKYRVLVVLRSDNTSLYATKDLALAIKKFEEYPLDRSIYVIDVRQSLYLQQIYKTLEIMGYSWASKCYHLGYEVVNLPGNVTMSSREGTVVLLEDLIREAAAIAYRIIQEKNPLLDKEIQKSVSLSVALGALKYTMLARENIKIVTFDWEKALDFNGQAAPYIQYAHVRANSILRNIEGGLPESLIPDYTLTPAEIQLIDLISRVPQEIQRAANDLKPLHLTNLVFEIARTFNDFYSICPVLKAEPGIREFRIRIVAASKQVIANLLSLLGITSPEVM